MQLLLLLVFLSMFHYIPAFFHSGHVGSLLNKRHLRYSRLFSTKNIVFLGTPKIAADSLRILNELCSKTQGTDEYRIICAVTQPPAASGRGKKVAESPVHTLCTSLSIPVLHPESAKDPFFLEKLKGMNVDLCVTAAYGNYLPKGFLSIPKYGTVNIHPSLLPLYRGSSPVQRCLIAGDKETGVTVLQTVSKMDAGPILKQIKIPLTGSEKASELLPRSFSIGSYALFDLLPSIFNGSIVKTPQNDSLATHTAKIDTSESLVNFKTMSAQDIHNRCRGFSEWPGIYSYFRVTVKNANGGTVSDVRRIKLITTRVLDCSVVSADSSADPTKASMFKAESKHVMVLVCGDGSVLGVEELQPANKSIMDARSLFNGIKEGTIHWVEPSSVAAEDK